MSPTLETTQRDIQLFVNTSYRVLMDVEPSSIDAHVLKVAEMEAKRTVDEALEFITLYIINTR